MRLVTHYVFTAGILALLLSSFTSYYLVLAGILSVAGNLIIDRLGHKEIHTRHGTIPTRTPLTHTVPRSAVWGMLPSIPFFVLGFLYGDIPWFLLLSIVIGPSHMILDAFTEAGIYVKKEGKWTRFALAHYRYDNSFINGAAIFLGFVMLVLSFHGYYYHYQLLSFSSPLKSQLRRG
ncbi:hypothetical protein HS7_20490 [Sulfolobales archaeon HS-7]|nr:hypothetical protein HS7_20490 [Sulfolobales archaeon HS-7]